MLIVENKGNQAGLIGRVNVVLYCPGAYFHQSDLKKYLDENHLKSDPSTQPPVWGVNIDLGTSPTTNRTIPARSSREISFILSRDMLRAHEKAFPRVGPDPAGNFCKALYNGWVRIKIAVELWDYKQTNPKVVKLPEPSGEEPFWRGCDTITQGLFCLDPKNWE